MSNRPAKAAVRAVGVATALLLAAAIPAGAAGPTRARGAGQLRDLQVTTAQPTDHATAQVTATESGGVTTVTLKVQGLDHSSAGRELGAHVHVGPCEAGNGAAAGPHYNATGGAVINDETEVWLDFAIAPNGTARATATVPFTIPQGGAGSVVVHELHTDHVTGAAGARWACLPVQF